MGDESKIIKSQRIPLFISDDFIWGDFQVFIDSEQGKHFNGVFSLGQHFLKQFLVFHTMLLVHLRNPPPKAVVMF
jgi:hypothetical protein